MKFSRSIVSVSVAAIILSAGSVARGVEKPPRASVNFPQGPHYFEGNDTYYELRIDNKKSVTGGPQWQHARAYAQTRVYKGRRGRLALINDRETLDFIRDTFRINEETWIGYAFYCKVRKLVSVEGEIEPLNARGMWAPRWNRGDGVTCKSEHTLPYMVVYLTKEDSGGVYWQAVGWAKYFTSYLVEYPPTKDANRASANIEKE